MMHATAGRGDTHRVDRLLPFTLLEVGVAGHFACKCELAVREPRDRAGWIVVVRVHVDRVRLAPLRRAAPTDYRSTCAATAPVSAAQARDERIVDEKNANAAARLRLCSASSSAHRHGAVSIVARLARPHGLLTHARHRRLHHLLALVARDEVVDDEHGRRLTHH
eukprot:5462774-Pleurochrysis_carterae.AAC.2